MFSKAVAALVVASLAVATPVAEVQERELEARITHTGQATYFEVGLGACGWWNGNNDMIVVSIILFCGSLLRAITNLVGFR